MRTLSIALFSILVLFFSLALSGCGGGGGGSSDSPLPVVNQAPDTPPSNGQGSGSGNGGGTPTSSEGGGGGNTSAPSTSTAQQDGQQDNQQQDQQQTQQQAVQVDPPGQRNEESSNQQAQQATINFDGTIPVHLNRKYHHSRHTYTVDPVLTVGSDGVLTPHITATPTTFDPARYDVPTSICIDPAKGCTAPPTRNPKGSLDSRIETLVQNPQGARQIRRVRYYDLDLDQDGVTDIVDDTVCKGAPKVCRTTQRAAQCNNGGNIDECSIYVWYESVPAQGVLDGWTITRSGKDSYSNGFTTRLHQDITLTFGDGTKIPCATQYTCSQSVREYNGRGGTHYGNPNYPGLSESQQNAYKQVGHDTVWVRTYVPQENMQTWFMATKKNGDNDYTSFGYWMRLNFSLETINSDYRVQPRNLLRTVFAAGTNPVTDVSRVAGTATYRGEAAGVVQWNDTHAQYLRRFRRYSGYDGAPVTLTADFDTMRMDVNINLEGRIHEPTGCIATSCLQKWRDVGPEQIDFFSVPMNDNGTFNGGRVRALGEVRIEGNKIITGVFPAQPTSANLEGQFYVPDGDNAPGQAAGTFQVQAGGNRSNDYYQVDGAFGTEKQ